jgi:hypothetical protein
MAIFRESAFWVGLVAALLQFLVNQHVLAPGVADFVNMAVVYIVGRLISKGAKVVFPVKP